MNDVELERTYASELPITAPSGIFYGRHLGWLDTRGGRNPVLRRLLHLAFIATPFGIDFDKRHWLFSPSRRLKSNALSKARLKLGHFEPTVGPSRWRDTDAVRMGYEVSGLPRPIKAVLYDEVKPLSEDLCLGIGGTNAARGYGDCFWFALSRAAHPR
jgi:hypothetical protein